MSSETGSIPFTQFLRPDGRPRDVSIDRPALVAAKAQQLIASGYRLECEELMNGTVSFTIAFEDEDVAIKLCPNGSSVPAAVDALIMGFNADAVAA